MVLASVRQMREAVERQVEDRVQKLKARLQRELSAAGSKKVSSTCGGKVWVHRSSRQSAVKQEVAWS